MSKVLHIVESFNGQATEKWLTLIASQAVQEGKALDWTFYCTQQSPGCHAGKVGELGYKVLCSPYPVSETLKFIAALRKEISDAEYKIIHSHHDIMSALYFIASIGLPVKRRIVHVHNTSLELPTSNRLKMSVGRMIFGQVCKLLATKVVGVSTAALDAFVKGRVQEKKHTVIHCAVDLGRHNDPGCNQQSIREELSIPKAAVVLLFVGRLIPYKNPLFVLELCQMMCLRSRDTYCVFVGTGNLDKDISEISELYGIHDRVRILGWRDDVRQIMAESDVLVCPSIEVPKEGLGLVVVEAQSIGLPVVMSLSVPDEAIVIPNIVERIALKAGSAFWSEKVIVVKDRKPSTNNECRRAVRESTFSAERSLHALMELYEGTENKGPQSSL